MPCLASRTLRAASKFSATTEVSRAKISRYHVPHSVRDHVDYITPGIALREVAGVHPRDESGLKKRFTNPLPPILQPILLPIEEFLGLAGSCGAAITPECIRRK